MAVSRCLGQFASFKASGVSGIGLKMAGSRFGVEVFFCPTFWGLGFQAQKFGVGGCLEL